MLLKGLLQAMVAVALGVVLWNQLLSEGQRQWLLAATGIAGRSGMTSDTYSKQPAATRPEDIPLFSHLHEQIASQQFNCLQPVTEVITEPPANQVYSWLDNSGKRHFSDQPPANQVSQDLSQKYTGETTYFDLQINTPDGVFAPLLREQLHRDVMAIYRYLTEQLALDHLRKVTVNLTLFNEPQNYAAYQQQHAPNLQGSAGFYSAVANEAVVVRQRDSELTKRVARHEATHVIMAGLYGMTPIWLNEGLAEVFSDYRNVALSRQFDVHPGRLLQLQKMIDADSLPPLESLLTIHPEQWQQADPAVMYPASWALVRFMLEDAAAREVLQAILRELALHPCAEIIAQSFIGNHFPGGNKVFALKWHSWLHSQLTN